MGKKNQTRAPIPSEKPIEMPDLLLQKRRMKTLGRYVSERFEEFLRAWQKFETISKTYDEQVEALLPQLLGGREGEIEIKIKIVNLFRELWQYVSRKEPFAL
jgi:hypothetical protein